jgi:hypothetical protein
MGARRSEALSTAGVVAVQEGNENARISMAALPAAEHRYLVSPLPFDILA